MGQSNWPRWFEIWMRVTAIALSFGLAEGVLGLLGLSWRAQVGIHVVMVGALAVGVSMFSRSIVGLVRRQETVILQTRQALEAREHHFRAFIEHCPEVIVLLDDKCTIRYSNPASTRLLGHAVGELVGRSAVEFIHPKDLESFRADFADVLQAPHLPMTTEFRWRDKGVAWRWMDVILTNRLDDPSVEAVVGSTRDITLREQGVEVPRRRKKELEVV